MWELAVRIEVHRPACITPPHPVKSHAIRPRLGRSEIRYYRSLIRAASSTDGITADPLTARMVRERLERAEARRLPAA